MLGRRLSRPRALRPRAFASRGAGINSSSQHSIANPRRCSGYSCSIEGQYCAPDKVGASGQPWCCVKGEWTPGTCPCKPGYGWDGPTTACKKCGDDADIWDPSWWEDGECTCVDGRTGPNCELLECASTTPTVSLGFLLLEVQWPRHARKLSRNEAFSGISAAFRAFDANSDNHLSVDEARTGIADGGMAVPSEVVHIWSRRQENGVRVEIHETASLCTPVCLKSVSAAAASRTTLQSLLTHDDVRETRYKLSDDEGLLL